MSVGGICWYCYWGWPEQVRAIYDEAVEALDGDDLARAVNGLPSLLGNVEEKKAG